MLIVFEGIDGAGKSTIAELFRNWAARNYGPARVLRNSAMRFDDPDVELHASRLRQLIWPTDVEEHPTDVMGTHYYLFLHAAWAAVVYRHRLLPLTRSGELVILDGSYFRVAAKAHVREGLDEDWLLSLFMQAPKPNLVILLDADPAVAWHRRPKFKPSELGHWDGLHSVEPFTAYVQYQTAIRRELQRFAGQFDWVVIDQKGGPAEDVLRQIVSNDRLRTLLGTSSRISNEP